MSFHDIERGHFCPRCKANSLCLIEDGACDNAGLCDRCIKQDVYDTHVAENRQRFGDW